MALRNLDFDTAIRQICQNGADSFDALVDACAAKLSACGLKPNSGKAVRKAPRHTGRRNPLAGQFRGSADLNVRAMVDWVESITPLGNVPAEDASESEKAEYAAMKQAHEQLVVIHASLADKK